MLVSILFATAAALTPPRPHIQLAFDHVQIFADEVAPVATYKALERSTADACDRLDAAPPMPYTPHGRDVAAQLVAALQWRVAAAHANAETRSVGRPRARIDRSCGFFDDTRIRRERASDATAPQVVVRAGSEDDAATVVITAPGDGDGPAPAWARSERWREARGAAGGRPLIGTLAFACVNGTTAADVLAAYDRRADVSDESRRRRGRG